MLSTFDNPLGYSTLVAYGYARLSKEEADANESESIKNQCQFLTDYCRANGIVLLDIYKDDGYSGSNFNRPGFKKLIASVEAGRANMVITKDLSRLGRDMRESSYYAEEYFPERGIVYIGVGDNFFSTANNTFAPLQFAVNEVMLRQTSQKIKVVLNNKKENGQYCAAAPYGYKKDVVNNKLIPDELSAPIVKRIFQMSANGESLKCICRKFNEEKIMPPLKFKATYRAKFSARGMQTVSDEWNPTTIARIMRNEVYLGHTLLGKSVKPSIKSGRKIPKDKSKWIVHRNTHEALVSQDIFDKAQRNISYHRKLADGKTPVRKSIFKGIARCGECGHIACSCGTVYKGERKKYWYLSCNYSGTAAGCGKTRIRYSDLCDIVRMDLNYLIQKSKCDFNEIMKTVIDRIKDPDETDLVESKASAEKRLAEIDAMIKKIYGDFVAGRISEKTLDSIIPSLESEATSLHALLETAESQKSLEDSFMERYRDLFDLAKKYQPIEELTRDIVEAFIKRINIYPKDEFGNQKIEIFYKFVGILDEKL